MKYLLTAFILLTPLMSHAAPSITFSNISGVSLVLTGTGFGAKTTPAPIRYDDFSNSIVDVDMSTATGGWWSNGLQPLTVTDANPRVTNGKSVNSLTASTSGSGSPTYPFIAGGMAFVNDVGFKTTKKFYLNYWYYFDPGTMPVGFPDSVGTPYWQIKSLRLLTDNPVDGGFNGDDYPSVFVDSQNFRHSGVSTATNYVDMRGYPAVNIASMYLETPVTPMVSAGWYNIEIQGQMDSSVGAGDASITFTSSRLNFSGAVVSNTKTNFSLINATNAKGNDYYDAVNMHNYIGNIPAPPAYNADKAGGYLSGYTVSYGGTYYRCILTHDPAQTPTTGTYWEAAPYGYEISTNLQYGDIYIDNSWARVVICDNATWANRTHCEIQPATAWADGAVTSTYNAGSFVNGSTAYIYVIDGAGTVSAASDPITIDNGQPDTTGPSVSSSKSSGTAISAKFALTLTASDNVGIASQFYCTGATTCTPALTYAAPFTVYPGQTACWDASDAAGNHTTGCASYPWPRGCR